MATWKKIIVSGSNAELNSATASFGFFGTASWAESASVALTASYVLSSSYALSSSHALSSSYAESSSYALSSSYSLSSSYALSASYAPKTLPGGSNTQIQFNSASIFSGSSHFSFDYVNNNLLLTGSLLTSGSNTFIGTQTVTGSLFTSGSNTLIGTTTLTGSLNITGSTTQIGNNNLFGNTQLSGSIIISGASGTNNPTVKIYGDTTHNGYIRFDPVSTNIDPTISASYIYVSGSTNDLYFTQNGAGYANTTRLRWLEGNLYTGLLHGGVITQVNTNTYQISSGSGIIVNLNSSLSNDPYPTIQFLNWGNLTNTIDALSGSFDQQFVAISSSAGTAVIKAQGIPYSDGDYNNFIPIGIVIHQNRSTINAVQTFPGVAYGWKQRSFDFIKAFGPLKIAGYTLAQSGSSTRGLVLSGGTAWVDGRNYIVDPTNPSYIVEAQGITTSKIYRYYQSGSNWQSNWGYNTNGGAGFTDIDPTQYSNAGTLTPVPVLNWTIQRVFYFPNSATKAFYIYYGNAVYSNKADALAAVTTETFNEAPNTTANAIYVGYMLLRHNADFTVPASYEFRQAGLFRGSGTGGGGGGGATTLAGLTDVSLSSLTYGDLLAYNASTGLWNNTHTLSGSYTLSGSLVTNDGVSVQSLTASFVSASSITGSLFGTASWATNAVTASFLPVGTYNITSSWATNAITASFLPAGTYNITSSWAQSSSRAVSSSYAVTSSFAVSASWAPGGGGATPGGSNTSIQFNSASTFSGNNSFTYQYDPNDVGAYRLLHLYNYDFAGSAINKNYPASYVPYNDSNPNSQRLGLSHFQISLGSGTGATTIYRWNALPNGNLTDLEMYGFKCDYSLLLIDTSLGSGNNVASRIGTLKAAWSWATANTPALNDDFVDGDLVYNELGLVTFTLQWNDPYIELQMDCGSITAGDTVFQGAFTNFGIRG